MALSYVLLTSLLEKPSTGIELARRFDRSMGFFWQATHQQIYRELAQLQTKLWISPLPTTYSDSRKKTYQVTALGQTQLRIWLHSHNPIPKTRNELMVKLRAEAQLGGNLILEELSTHRQLHQSQLALYQQIAAKDQQKMGCKQRELAIQQQILTLGIRFEQLWITWLDEMLQLLDQQPDQD